MGGDLAHRLSLLAIVFAFGHIAFAFGHIAFAFGHVAFAALPLTSTCSHTPSACLSQRPRPASLPCQQPKPLLQPAHSAPEFDDIDEAMRAPLVSQAIRVSRVARS